MDEFFQIYLWAFVWSASLPLGSLALLMIYHTTGGRWGEPIMESAKRVAACTPVLILLFLPLGLGLSQLYPWAQPAPGAAEPLWQHRSFYMNATGFWLRSMGALLIWSYLAWRLQSRVSTPALQKTASVGLALHLFLTGMVSVDWVMSLELHFSSTVFGLLVMVLQVVTAFSLLITVACHKKRRLPKTGPFYDLGGLLLAQVMLVGYLSFSQLVIIWSGNLPHEIGWLEPRVWGAWKWMAIGLLIVQLFLPFLCLMWGGMKRNQGNLGLVSGVIVLLSPFHFFWLVTPSFHPDRIPPNPGYLGGALVVALLWKLALPSSSRGVRDES